ncbi:DUF2004 domain-containing protein [Pseudoalteromonas distincta]
MTMKELLKLINRNFEDKEVQSFLTSYSTSYGYDDDEDEYYVSLENIGLEIIGDNKKRITTIFLSSNSRGAIKEYSPIKNGLSFSSNKSEVRAVMGTPTSSGNPLSDTILEATGGFDRYDNEKYAVHFEYSKKDSTISLITLMCINDAP